MSYKKNSWLVLFALLLLLFFTRVYALFNVGAMFYNFEGLYRGWKAKELLEGAGFWSIFNNPYFPAEGGSVVIGYLVALFFSIFGDSLFSLVLIPIVFSLLILLVFYILLKKYFSLPVAVIFSILFIFPPWPFFRFSLLTLGFHFEAVLFSILGALCFFEIFFNPTNYQTYLGGRHKKKLYWLFATLGLVSGFGTYFFYTYPIMLFTIFLYWFILDKRFFLKIYFLIFLFGFVIGFIPWIVYNFTHGFAGLLHIEGKTCWEILFSKDPSQALETFTYIITKRLPEFLGWRLYITIIFSLVAIVVYHKNKYKHKGKELFFPAYVLIFVFVWSVLYIPIGGESVPPWMSGLWGRLFHVYPFLFVLVGLCFSRLIPDKKKKKYFLKAAFLSIFTIWILRIGFYNYSELLSSSGTKIAPLKIKGYSARMAYSGGKKNILSLSDRDMHRGILVATRTSSDLGQVFFNTGNSQRIQGSLAFQLTNPLEPYYYLLLGLNTGDLLEDYDIPQLNNLISQKINPVYLHYLYEGVAVSVMNRRRDELVRHMDFIQDIPTKYRHYFLLELGRVISSYPDAKTREEKLHYALKKFIPFFSNYIYRGFIEALAPYKIPDNPRGVNTQEDYQPYYYRAMARNIFGNLTEEREISGLLARFGITKENEQYFYWGIVEGLFNDDHLYKEEEIKSRIETIISCAWEKKDFLCEGLGLTLGSRTFGDINKFTGRIESVFEDEQLRHFYYGYSLSLKERYGLDIRKIKELIDGNVPERFRATCYRTIWQPNA